ncbi:hypothetical protein L1987_48343 [Smallanthus sonchifolius]|uniref:Uncharacterized protein n=1 Tax=Smallanthus sonchifolius TaxID=185202 RepID=A0ACB9FRP2_9ASTR|nr:hypothetical protein L1987_48343 [Smallanthus sonchifolius]
MMSLNGDTKENYDKPHFISASQSLSTIINVAIDHQETIVVGEIRSKNGRITIASFFLLLLSCGQIVTVDLASSPSVSSGEETVESK